MKKRKEKKEDGRNIFYYTFAENEKKAEKTNKAKKEEK